jgi:hypothetical protein
MVTSQCSRVSALTGERLISLTTFHTYSGLVDNETVKVPETWSSSAHDHHRKVAVTSLTFLPDEGLEPIYPGRDQGVWTPGVTHLTLDASAPRREVAEFHVRMNGWDERGLAGEYQMKMGDGGYLEFRDVDFGDGAATFRVEASSETLPCATACSRFGWTIPGEN